MPADKIADLTPDESKELGRMLAGLHDCGYVDIDQHEKFRPGVRIRHGGQRWYEALTDGTGVVLAITERPDSGWSQTYGMPDVEMVVLFDKPSWEGGSRLSQLAQYHVGVASGVDR